MLPLLFEVVCTEFLLEGVACMLAWLVLEDYRRAFGVELGCM